MEPRRRRAYHLETSGTSSLSGTTSDTSSSSTTSSSSVQSKKSKRSKHSHKHSDTSSSSTTSSSSQSKKSTRSKHSHKHDSHSHGHDRRKKQRIKRKKLSLALGEKRRSQRNIVIEKASRAALKVKVKKIALKGKVIEFTLMLNLDLVPELVPVLDKNL